EATLRKTIDQLENNVQIVDDANKPISSVLGKLDVLMQRQVDLADDCQLAVRRVSLALAALPAGEDKLASDLQRTVAGLVHHSAEVKKTVQDLSNEFKVAQFRYTVRRYDAEAKHN